MAPPPAWWAAVWAEQLQQQRALLTELLAPIRQDFQALQSDVAELKAGQQRLEDRLPDVDSAARTTLDGEGNSFSAGKDVDVDSFVDGFERLTGHSSDRLAGQGQMLHVKEDVVDIRSAMQVSLGIQTVLSTDDIEIELRSALLGDVLASVRMGLGESLSALRKVIASKLGLGLGSFGMQMSDCNLDTNDWDPRVTLFETGLFMGETAIVNVVQLWQPEWYDWSWFPIMIGVELNNPDLVLRCATQAGPEDMKHGSLYHFVAKTLPLFIDWPELQRLAPGVEVKETHVQRRTVDFALKAAADRELRFKQMISPDGNGICVGNTRKASLSGVVADAKWGEKKENVSEIFEVYECSRENKCDCRSSYSTCQCELRYSRTDQETRVFLCF